MLSRRKSGIETLTRSAEAIPIEADWRSAEMGSPNGPEGHFYNDGRLSSFAVARFADRDIVPIPLVPIGADQCWETCMSVDAPTKNLGLLAWVDEIAKLTKPDQIEWCDGSQEEYDRMFELMLDTGRVCCS